MTEVKGWRLCDGACSYLNMTHNTSYTSKIHCYSVDSSQSATSQRYIQCNKTRQEIKASILCSLCIAQYEKRVRLSSKRKYGCNGVFNVSIYDLYIIILDFLKTI